MNDALPFTLAAVALLGSPGPAITALVAIGRAHGFRSSLPFFFALQLGLALAAGLSVAGLVTLLTAAPAAQRALTIVAIGYLVWLAWKTATAPLGEPKGVSATASAGQGFLLGITNPKAYLAFASLVGSFTILTPGSAADGAAKWLILIAVIATVDVAWLTLGALLGGLKLPPHGERLMNLAMGGAILAAAVTSFG